MATTVKRKIRAGTIFLFLLLLLAGGPGIYYVVKLKKDAQVILKNNYESLDYGHRMLRLLDSLPNNQQKIIPQLKQQLQFQAANVTEPGEQQATDSLHAAFNALQNEDHPEMAILAMKRELQKILSMNMNAIEAKNKRASKTADNAIMYLTFIITIIFLVAITFAYNFPSIVTSPIKELTEAIKQIGAKNYKHRIHLRKNDEFGQMADAYNSMAERLEYFESSNLNKILFEKNRAEAVIHSLKDASVGIDKDDIVLFANNQALQLLGLSSEDMVGKPVKEMSSRNDLFRFLIESENSSPFKIVVDNRENYFTKEVLEVKQQDGAANKVILLKNITSFKELDVAKTNFIATISHELKTPLASSDFGLKLLEDERVGTLSGEQKELVRHLKEDNQRMLRILSELLNMSQVEAGKLELKMEAADPLALINKAISSVQAAADEKNVSLHTDMDSALPMINADEEKVSWVLVNFLTNAIKFSPLRSVVTLAVVQDKERLVFTVYDQGPGIDRQYLPKIFDRYFRVPDNANPGTGLGLAISKEFIEAMKGRIWVESEIGRGSSFSFALNKTASQ